jgi:hypothetical protein
MLVQSLNKQQLPPDTGGFRKEKSDETAAVMNREGAGGEMMVYLD